MENVILLSKNDPSNEIKSLLKDFFSVFTPLEVEFGGKPILIEDLKSNAFYLTCHLRADVFVNKADFQASINDADDEELYKLNRDVTENESAFLTMVSDAKSERTFEDIVVEFDTSYRDEVPLKIYGGQHRIKAIQAAVETHPKTPHGFRIYLGLTRDQKVEIATINNTSIAVSTDLLDRMREQLIGTELRDLFQKAGLLEEGQDFSDRKDPLIPTVRIARTFVVNFWQGRNAASDSFHQPIVCKAGGMDSEYAQVREKIDWNNADLVEAATRFSELNRIQREKIEGRERDKSGEFARKALSLAVVAGWSYAAGLFSVDPLKKASLYALTENLGKNEDPLNAKALSQARLKGIDPDTYRGLGARISADELGRMLEVFVVVVEKATEKKITSQLAVAAIQSFEAKKATHKAAESFAKI